MPLLPCCDYLGGGLADKYTVLHRTIGRHAVLALFFGSLPCCKQLGSGQLTECIQIGTVGLFHDRVPETILLCRRLGSQHLRDTAAAAHNCLGEQTFRQRAQAELLHAHRTGALPHDGDVVGIAAEGRNVGAHPLQGRQLVKKRIVAGVAGLLLQRIQTDKAQRAKAVVDGHGYAALCGPLGPVKVLFVAAAAAEAAAVNVEDDRQLAFRTGIGGGPDIQKKAVLTVGIGLAKAELLIIKGFFRHLGLVVKGARLVAAGTVGGGFIDAVPVGHSLGVSPALGCGVADPLVGSHAGPLAVGAADRAAGGLAQILLLAHKISSPFCCRRWASRGGSFPPRCCSLPACASAPPHGAYPWRLQPFQEWTVPHRQGAGGRPHQG